MRRRDREVSDFSEQVKILERCKVIRLGIQTEGAPYLLPLNFGCTAEQGRLTIYFHGAAKGEKYELLAKNPVVSFEADSDEGHNFVVDLERMMATMEFESVIGQGTVTELTDPAEKEAALKVILQHYGVGDEFHILPPVLSVTRVNKLTVSAMTGKRREKHLVQKPQPEKGNNV